MLLGIPNILPPDLLKVMFEMGHGDELVLADANFPAASHAQRIVRCDGHGIVELLEAIVKVLPLDDYVEKPASVMAVVSGDPILPSIWESYEAILKKKTNLSASLESLERFSFYERSRSAYAIVATGERTQYGNLILKKGVIREHE
ncbi:RbsD/FucU family protein [Paenibacillus sp. NRS-1760]|uniref:RbsD/FucU family protein n=1 Tax=Paenibacillus sp. NRS-1760 TaxID=3233902 RepID=UPI003D2AE1E4